MDERSHLLSDQIQRVRDAVTDGAPVVSAFRARPRVVLSTALMFGLWILLSILVTRAMIAAFPNMHGLVMTVIAVAAGQVGGTFLAQGSRRAIAFCEDNSVIVARTGAFGFGRARSIERIYHASTTIEIEYENPRWRSQRITIDGDNWYSCAPSLRFRRRRELEQMALAET